MPSTKSAAPANRLLAMLPRKDRQRFLAGCESIDLGFAEILREPGERIREVYFPSECFISQITTTDGHSSLEIGMVGDEGMLGIPLVLGVAVSPQSAVVQGAGPAWRMDAERFRRELELSPALQDVLKRYCHVAMVQAAQTAVCTRFHVVEERLARWLSMTRDRAHSDNFHVTHEFLANMLGVRRVGVTKAATALQKRGLISYRRGNLQVVDSAGLEAAACTCYAADKAIYARTMAR